MEFSNNKSKNNNNFPDDKNYSNNEVSDYKNYLKSKPKFEPNQVSKDSSSKKTKSNVPIFETIEPINYTQEIENNNYQKHFQKLSSNSVVPDVPINLPISSKFIPITTIEIDDMNNTNNKKANNPNQDNQNQKNNLGTFQQNNQQFQQQLQQQMQFANQLQLMQYRAFLMSQQNQFWQQQMMAQQMNNPMFFQNPMFATNPYHQMMAQQQAAHSSNGLITPEQKQQADSLVNLVGQVSKLMNSFQNQMAMQNDILARQQKQVIQQQEIINKLHDRLLKDDFKALESKTNVESEEDDEEEYLEPSETLNILDNDFNLPEQETIVNNEIRNFESSLTTPSFINASVPNQQSVNEYSKLANEELLTSQINVPNSNQNFFQFQNQLQQQINNNLAPTTQIVSSEPLKKNEIDKTQETNKQQEENVDEFLELAKSNPSQRFWEALVGKPKYGFYNNKVWHWLGYFDRLAKWHPYKSAGEMPTLPILHTGLIKQNSADSLFWKRLIDNPEYGHRENGVWIWDGVFDQNCNWIPDPTSDKYVINNYPKLDYKPQPLPEQLPIKNINSNNVETILDSYNPLDFVGNEFYGYYDDSKRWVWTAQPGSLEKQKVVITQNASPIKKDENIILNQPILEVQKLEEPIIQVQKEPEILIELPKQQEVFQVQEKVIPATKADDKEVHVVQDISLIETSVQPIVTEEAPIQQIQVQPINTFTSIIEEKIESTPDVQETVEVKEETKIEQESSILESQPTIESLQVEESQQEVEQVINEEPTPIVEEINSQEDLALQVEESKVQEEESFNEPIVEEEPTIIDESKADDEIAFEDKKEEESKLEEEVTFDDQPKVEEATPEESKVEDEIAFEDKKEESKVEEEVTFDDQPKIEESTPEETKVEDEIAFEDKKEELTPQLEPTPEIKIEETKVVEPSKLEEVKEATSQNNEYWKQFVGNPDYGHYDGSSNWNWAGYFDDNNQWVADPDYKQEPESIIYSDTNGNIDFNKFVGNLNFGYYDEERNWDWYAGDYDADGNWVVIEADDSAPAEEPAASADDGFDPDAWLSQFSAEDADRIFGGDNKEEDKDKK